MWFEEESAVKTSRTQINTFDGRKKGVYVFLVFYFFIFLYVELIVQELKKKKQKVVKKLIHVHHLLMINQCESFKAHSVR